MYIILRLTDPLCSTQWCTIYWLKPLLISDGCRIQTDTDKLACSWSMKLVFCCRAHWSVTCPFSWC